MADDSRGRRRTKVERVMATYGLEEWGDRLEAEWLGDRAERSSLRTLATQFNLAILRTALRASGETMIAADLESTYRTLTGDDVPPSDELRKRRELERMGVDVDSVSADFVTHQAVHSYLTKVRGAQLNRDGADRLERKRETVQRLVNRTQAVTDSTLEELIHADLLSERNYEVFVTVRTVCEDCGDNYRADELIARGGCDCER